MIILLNQFSSCIAQECPCYSLILELITLSIVNEGNEKNTEGASVKKLNSQNFTYLHFFFLLPIKVNPTTRSTGKVPALFFLETLYFLNIMENLGFLSPTQKEKEKENKMKNYIFFFNCDHKKKQFHITHASPSQ